MTETVELSDEQYAIVKVEDLVYVYGRPEASAQFKLNSADFIVRETLSFEPEGEGTHAFLYIEKINTNTEWLVRQLARFVGTETRNIGYAGLKDRNAVTYQWLSVNLEGIEEPDWDNFDVVGCKIIKKTYHRKKLKRGSIKYNSFQIVLKGIEQKYRVEIDARIEQIKNSGVPNYFAQQRFGHDYNNLFRAVLWFRNGHKIKKRAERGIILSAARSMVFNYMLSQRIEKIGWNELLTGEVMMLDGTHSFFSAGIIDDELLERFMQGDIHPTSVLWGRGCLSSEKQLLELEQEKSENLSNWCRGLEMQGLKQERRAARLFPRDLLVSHSPQNSTLSFSLPSGCYATTVLREIVQF
ncbi:MAG: tRNA pseudouridine(13) synthase TruD [gamma proteobacterium symbiont of Taylorina sp.]|nr:tRNA pseudouridine(13) synthase TruD [gamma proteobacterium symbiont of Taylorina sp.]